MSQRKHFHVERFIRENGGNKLWEQKQGKGTIICKACHQSFCVKSFILNRHVKTKKHMKRACARNKNASMPPSSNDNNTYESDFAKLIAFLNIPIAKVEHSFFKYFIEKYTGHIVPSRFRLVRSISDNCKKTMEIVKEKTKDKSLFVLMNETRNLRGIVMVAVLIGSLDGSFLNRPYLINVASMEEVNEKAVENIVTSSILDLFGVSYDLRHVKVFVTDEAAYCVKAAELLKKSCSEIIHVTCAAHGFHPVAELAREKYKDVNTLISEVKKIFLHSERVFSLLRLTHCSSRVLLSEKRVKDLLRLNWNMDLVGLS